MLSEVEVNCAKHGRVTAHLTRDATALCSMCWDEACAKALDDPEVQQRIHKEVARGMLGLSISGSVKPQEGP